MKSEEFKFMKEKATTSEDFGNRQSPFAEARHFIGRLAYHVKAVKILFVAARRIPSLVLDPEIIQVPSPPALVFSPTARSKLNLDGIINRMVSQDRPLISDLQGRLKSLNVALNIENIVRKEYEKKNFKPQVHAELILLEFFYRNRQNFEFVGNDRFIGSSKPACYCCHLYIREHPGGFVEPATHQKIYLNWMPPTSVPEVQDPESYMANHERAMLNSMVKAIRKRTVEQIKMQSGKRQKHFDSVTGDTFSASAIAALQETHETDVLQVPGRRFHFEFLI